MRGIRTHEGWPYLAFVIDLYSKNDKTIIKIAQNIPEEALQEDE